MVFLKIWNNMGKLNTDSILDDIKEIVNILAVTIIAKNSALVF